MRARILNASAGSGKTYQLAYKYVRDVVEQPGIYRHILAVTFTNKATEEMKSRILKEIHLLASGQPSSYLDNLCRELSLDAATVRRRAREVRSKILHDYSRFTVLTIDTFFQRILRAFIKELGIDLNYNVEIETASVLTKSADTLIEQITTDRDLQRWLTDFVQERIDEGKKWDIRDGILTLGGELFKEKNKDALSAARPREELARIVGEATAHAAATKKRMQDAAAEAVRIIGDAGASVADFPYKGSGFAAYFYAVAGGSFERYGSRAEAACTRDEAWGKPGSTAQGLRSRLQPLLREMCGLYDENVRAWNTCDLLRENYRSFALLSDLYAKVQQMCDQENMMLLSETKYILSEFIGHNDAPFIYEKVGNRFEHFMIDEFQDTSVKEWENFLPLLQNAMAQSEATSVLIVGDIKQSIYRFRLADPTIFLDKYARFADFREAAPGAPRRILLRENFRSRRAVLEAANHVFSNIMSRALGELDYDDAARLRAGASYPGDDVLPELAVLELPGADDDAPTPEKAALEADYAARRIRALIDGGTPVWENGAERPAHYGDVVILLRSANSVGPVYRAALEAHGLRHMAVETAHAAIVAASSQAPSIVLLDLGLPDMDGVKVVESVRAWSGMPIIVVSARSEDADKIRALDAGADDYLTKPFSVEELLARIRTTLRRLSYAQTGGVVSEGSFDTGELHIDFDAGIATMDGEELHLTPIEYKLLCLLAHNADKVLTHQFILHEIWGTATKSDLASLRVFMGTLRKKIESDPAHPRYIQTHVGIGYRLVTQG